MMILNLLLSLLLATCVFAAAVPYETGRVSLTKRVFGFGKAGSKSGFLANTPSNRKRRQQENNGDGQSAVDRDEDSTVDGPTEDDGSGYGYGGKEPFKFWDDGYYSDPENDKNYENSDPQYSSADPKTPSMASLKKGGWLSRAPKKEANKKSSQPPAKAQRRLSFSGFN